jgi:hypothetical protein
VSFIFSRHITEWKCTHGHDLCHDGIGAGPECPCCILQYSWFGSLLIALWCILPWRFHP